MKNENEITTLQESQLELVVSEKTIGSLVTNAKAIKTLVEGQIQKYDISNYSSDDIAKCKQDKALLNKAAKALNDKRIALEKEWNTPFDEFKTTVKETVDLIKSAATKIDSIIKQDDERAKEEKMAEIRKIAEKVGLPEVNVKLEKVMNPKWLNKSTSLKSIEKELAEKVETINESVATLLTYTDVASAALARYHEDLDLNAAIKFANELQKQKIEQRAAEIAESKQETPEVSEPAQEQAHAQVEESKPVETTSEEDAIDAFNDALGIPPVVRQEPEVFDRGYVITATRYQFVDIEKYLDSLGVNYTID